MKVLLYRTDTDDPALSPIEREASDAREILAAPGTLYALEPGVAPTPPPPFLVAGMSAAGLALVIGSGLAPDEMSRLKWDELALRLPVQELGERDVAALRGWHASLSEKESRTRGAQDRKGHGKG